MVLPYINMNPPQVYTCSPSWTPLPPPSLYHPSGSSQCTSPKHPVSCIEPGLAIRFIYDIIHVSMPFSQIIPPSPSPTESKSLFYTSVSLLLSRTQGYHYHLSKFHIYVLVYCTGEKAVAPHYSTLARKLPGTGEPGRLPSVGSHRVGHDWLWCDVIWCVILYWCFSFWLTSLCILGSSFIHLIRTDSKVFFLMAE